MNRKMNRNLYIFCGGVSRRMGRDKALLKLSELKRADRFSDRSLSGKKQAGKDASESAEDVGMFDADPGLTVIEFQCRRTQDFFREVVLLSGTTLYSVPNRQLQDSRSDGGPLGGLLSALKDTGSGSYVSVIPVDLPFLSEKTLKQLARLIPDEDMDALVLRSDEAIQPLAGIYSSNIISALWVYLNRGERRVMGFLSEIRHDFIPVPNDELANLNSPDDLHLRSD